MKATKHEFADLYLMNDSLSTTERKVVGVYHRKKNRQALAVGKCTSTRQLSTQKQTEYGILCLSKQESDVFLTLISPSHKEKTKIWSMQVIDGEIQKDLSLLKTQLHFNLSSPMSGNCVLDFERAADAETFYHYFRGGGKVKAAVQYAVLPERYEVIPSVESEAKPDVPPPPLLNQKLHEPRPLTTPTAPPLSLALSQLEIEEVKWRPGEAPSNAPPPKPPKRTASLIQNKPNVNQKTSWRVQESKMSLSDQSLQPNIPKEVERNRSFNGKSNTYDSLGSILETVVPAPSSSTSSQKMTLSPEVEDFYPEDLRQIRLLQKGGQGSVQLASTKFFPRVAVKYFDLKMSKSTEYGARELMNLLKVASHPHLVQTRGVLHSSKSGKERGEFPLGYLMEYMPEGSLHSVIHSNPPIPYDLKDCMNWIRQASSALCYLHSKGILHRDVKPANMLLADKRRRLKLCDLGLSANFDVQMTADVGTVLYMAPEVIATSPNRTSTYDQKCDVYSLGLCLWEILNRKIPYVCDGLDLFTLISKLRGANGIRPKIQPNCDAKIADMIRRCWSYDATKRPTMEEVHEFSVLFLEEAGFFEDYE